MEVSNISEYKVENPRKELSRLIRGDKHLSLIRLIRSQSEKTPTNDASFPSTKEIVESICSHRAEDCFTSLFREALRADSNVPLEGELYPLHIAAQSLWLFATRYLLCSTAHRFLHFNDPANSPLTLALNSIRDNTCAREWNPKISIFKLIYIFCLPEMKEPLETVKLLASNREQLEAISSRCVLQGEVVKLAALLFVAWDKLVEPFSDQGIKGCPTGRLIWSEFQHYQENCISQSSNSSAEIHERGANLLNAWKLLEILDIARNTIEKLYQDEDEDEDEDEEIAPHAVPFLVSSELNARHNIYLEPEDIYADDVKCLRPRLTPKQKAWLFRSIDRKVRSVSSLPALSKRHGGAEGVGSLHCFHTVAVSSHMKFRCSAEKLGSSHSFHTLVPNMNLVKPVTSQLSHACEKPGAWFPSFLRSQGMSSSMSRLFSILKRM